MRHHPTVNATPVASAAASRSTVQENTQQYLSFYVGDEVFAMDIRGVREIIQHGAMTVVPLMPDFVRGIINLRGAVVPVIDLPCRLGRGRTAAAQKTCVIIYDVGPEGDKVELGVLVDAVSEVLHIAPTQIEAVPNFGTTVPREYILGLTQVGAGFVPLLDPDKVFNVDDMAAIVAAQHGV